MARSRIAHRSLEQRSAGGVRPARRTSIRWDRLGGRWALAVIALMLVFYVAPVQNYLRQRSEAGDKKSELQALERDNRGLKARVKALSRDSVIELEARGLGMVKEDERAFVVK